jgi:hypothetical protein
MKRIAIAGLLIVGTFATSPGARQEKGNPDAQVLQDFKQRIDKYMELHNRLEKKAPRMKSTEDAAKIKASQDALAALIRGERATAKQGEIFTPAVATVLRRQMSPEVKGRDGAETKKSIKDDAPPTAEVPLKVNAQYPENAPLPTVPPNLLANLPQLPEDLEYRIIGRTLILRDVHANLIVDYLPKAIQ